jgi:TerC family integral membrane protein
MQQHIHHFFQGTVKLLDASDPLLPTSKGISLDGSKESLNIAIFTTMKIVCAAFAFGVLIWLTGGQELAFEFFAAYLVEQSLSVDNLIVMVMLFEYFRVPQKFQTRVLNWGIIGAVAMRGTMILVGVHLFERFAWIQLVFAAILLWSAYKFITEDEEAEDVSENFVVKLCSRLFNTSKEFDEERFWTQTSRGSYVATPLLMCLVCVELSDVVFAVDSIPAVLAVSSNTFVVYTSNIFAIMGLRSLYTIIARAVQSMPFLKPAVALVLGFVGIKLLLAYFNVEIITTKVSLIVVGILVLSGVGLSLLSLRLKNSGYDLFRGKRLKKMT